jgi:hypothetical protein
MVYLLLTISLDWLGLGPFEGLVTFLAVLQLVFLQQTHFRVRHKAVGATPDIKIRIHLRFASSGLTLLRKRLFALGSAVEAVHFILVVS